MESTVELNPKPLISTVRALGYSCQADEPDGVPKRMSPLAARCAIALVSGQTTVAGAAHVGVSLRRPCLRP